MKTTIGKWHRNINQGGVFRSIHNSHLIGQYIVRCTKGWAVNDCPCEYGVSGIRSEHARFIEAKRHADRRVNGMV